jgi:[protein-PII] uridylyltransferase
VRREVSVRELSERHRVFVGSRRDEPVSDRPTRIVIDIQSSPTRTIVDVFAHDRPGLLYIISRTLFQLGLSVELARIATHVDQVVDVFYVVDRSGKKIEDAVRSDEIIGRLESAIAHLQRHGLSRSAVAATEDPGVDESLGNAQ